MENARDFDPPDPRMIDMSPKGMMASTSRTMPSSRLSAVSIMVSTTNPAATSRIPLGRSQARVSASDAGGLRPNDPEIRSGDTTDNNDPHSDEGSQGKRDSVVHKMFPSLENLATLDSMRSIRKKFHRPPSVD